MSHIQTALSKITESSAQLVFLKNSLLKDLHFEVRWCLVQDQKLPKAETAVFKENTTVIL